MTRKSISSLPEELLVAICHHLRPQDLKTLRLTAKIFFSHATAKLYLRFTLFPHSRSFQRLLNIAKTESLVCLVQHLTYDATLCRIAFEKSVQLHSVADTTLQERQIAYQNAQLMDNQTLRSNSPLENLAQLSRLEEIFALLPKLDSIEVLDSAIGLARVSRAMSKLRVPVFYERLANEISVTQLHMPEQIVNKKDVSDTSFAIPVLQALPKVPGRIKSLVFIVDSWYKFLSQGDIRKLAAVHSGKLDGLVNLTIWCRDTHYFNGLKALKNLTNLLKHAPKLEILDLSFRQAGLMNVIGPNLDNNGGHNCRVRSLFHRNLNSDSVDDSGPPNNSKLASPAELLSNRKLTTLRLNGLVCTPTEFHTLFSAAPKTLKHLTLSNLLLMPEEHEGRRSCLVALFHWIRDNLKLETLQLHSIFANGGWQYWALKQEFQTPNSQLQRTISYMLKSPDSNSENPIAQLAIKPEDWDLETEAWTGIPPNMFMLQKYKGDSSFRCLYRTDEERPTPQWYN